MHDVTQLRVTASRSGSVLGVLVRPRARVGGVVGIQGDLLKVAVTAPPSDGKANAATEEVLAEALGIAPSRVRLVAGATARRKRILVADLGPEEVLSRLGDVLSSRPHERR